MGADAPGATSLRETLSEARATVNQEGGTPPEGEQTETGQTGEQTTGESGGTTQEETFLENVTAEELAEINADPRLKKAYNLMLKGFKDKTTGLSQKQREIEEARQQEERENAQARALLDALKDDPDGVLMDLARRRGKTVQEIKKEAETVETDKELIDLFGADYADEIAPTFYGAVDKRVKAAMAPVIDYLRGKAETEQRREIANDIRAFNNEVEALGEKITPEIEKRMEEITSKIDPAEGVSNLEFLRYVYRIATGGETRSKVTKDVARRMEESIKNREPESLPTGGHETGPRITEGMNLRDSLRAVREWNRGRSGR